MRKRSRSRDDIVTPLPDCIFFFFCNFGTALKKGVHILTADSYMCVYSVCVSPTGISSVIGQ